MDQGNNGYNGKKLLIVFEDGDKHFSKKEGVCTDSNEQEIILDGKHIIPRTRIIRAEIIKKRYDDD